MTCDFFIKSWRKDRFLLDYCLRSLQKRAIGFRQTIVLLPKGDEPHFATTDFRGAKVIWVNETIGNGYLGQQVFKHRAYEYTDADFILFPDSDCFAFNDITPSSFFNSDNKPIHLITPYGLTGDKGMEAWKEVTSRSLGFDVAFECMRAHPAIYHRDTLIECVKYLEAVHAKSLESYVASQPGNHYSEFNVIGSFALKFQPHLYDWRIATGSSAEYPRMEQAWSWAPDGDDRGLSATRIRRYEDSLNGEQYHVAGNITTLKNRRYVGDWLNKSQLIGEGAEIGVMEGENAENILTYWKGTLYLIDPWVTQSESIYRDGTNKIDFESALQKTRHRTVKFSDRVIIHREMSDQAFKRAADQGKVFDFVYLDGNHSSPQVNRDLEQWWTLVKSGGLFGGHDYMDLDTPEWKCDVKKSVDDFAASRGLKVHITEDAGHPSWWILK